MPHAATTLDPPAALRGLTRLWNRRAAPDGVLLGAPLVDRVLAARGLADPGRAALFLEPKLTHLHEPSLMADMDRAAERLLAAGAANQPIVIYGDYDVDGITATAILWHTLRALFPDAPISTYVPHRIDEGYGLSSDALEDLARAGAKVVVSVDCGITAHQPALAALRAGLDLIITDHHHLPAGDLPAAYAVVHPRRPGAPYPFGDLSGAGVAFKLAWRLGTMSAGGSRAAPHVRSLLLELLAFASLGTIADIVPLMGENRIIARFGLGRIGASPFAGLRALVEASGLDHARIDSYDVGFRLAPRLNACGRLGHAREAVELFTAATGQRARDIAEALTRLNDQRRLTEREIARQAEAMALEAGMDSPDHRAIVLARDDWHQGVIGIVCARLVQRFGRPVILLARNGDMWKGSGRSVPGFPLTEALGQCAEHLAAYGGHDMAAGLAASPGHLEAFAGAFTAVANARLTPEQMIGSITIDADARPEELTPEAVRALDRLAPFGQGDLGQGQGNPPVRLRLADVRLIEPPLPFGATGKHLGLRVRGASERVIRLVAWSWAERAQGLLAGQRLDAVVTPAISSWSGQVEPELQDLRVLRAGEAGAPAVALAP